ncbi:MAG TPA: dual specificity protein phosphatase family protein [Dissulfurispiraceae bacterium]
MKQARKSTGYLAVFLSAFFIYAVFYIFFVREQGNFRAVTESEAYRSAQLGRSEFIYFIKKYRIRSVINLRGEHPNRAWYREELKACRELGVNHYDVFLSASSEPSPIDQKKLLEAFKDAPRPVLMHCRSGADRAGLASAMWKVLIDKEPKTEAEKQLSIFFGHLPVGSTYAMDSFFEKWEPGPGL